MKNVKIFKKEDETKTYFKLVKLHDRLAACLYGRTGNIPQDVRLMDETVFNIDEALSFIKQYISNQLDHNLEIIPGPITSNVTIDYYKIPKAIFICRFDGEFFEYRILGQMKFTKLKCHLTKLKMEKEIRQLF